MKRESVEALDDDAPVRGDGPLRGRPPALSVHEDLPALGVDRGEGPPLLPDERRYLQILRSSRGPMSVRRIAGLLGTTVDTVVDLIEPHLFRHGLATTTPRGRMATERA